MTENKFIKRKKWKMSKKTYPYNRETEKKSTNLQKRHESK